MGKLRWGLIPGWAKDEKIGYKMINARWETVDSKPSYRHAFSWLTQYVFMGMACMHLILREISQKL